MKKIVKSDLRAHPKRRVRRNMPRRKHKYFEGERRELVACFPI
jgi:hypothetical protein